MEQKKFEAVMILLVPQIVNLICQGHSLDELTATDDFYKSKVYESLEDEETKLWHLSPLTLFNMYDEERRTGDFGFPEEV